MLIRCLAAKGKSELVKSAGCSQELMKPIEQPDLFGESFLRQLQAIKPAKVNFCDFEVIDQLISPSNSKKELIGEKS